MTGDGKICESTRHRMKMLKVWMILCRFAQRNHTRRTFNEFHLLFHQRPWFSVVIIPVFFCIRLLLYLTAVAHIDHPLRSQFLCVHMRVYNIDSIYVCLCMWGRLSLYVCVFILPKRNSLAFILGSYRRKHI